MVSHSDATDTFIAIVSKRRCRRAFTAPEYETLAESDVDSDVKLGNDDAHANTLVLVTERVVPDATSGSSLRSTNIANVANGRFCRFMR